MKDELEQVKPDMETFFTAYKRADFTHKKRALSVLLGTDSERDAGRGSDDGERRLLNQMQIAEYLGIHPSTVRRWNIPCRKLGRLPRYSIPEVQNYVGSEEFKHRLNTTKGT